MNPFATDKTAAAPYVAGTAPEMAEVNNSAKAEALRRALRSGLLGLGAGAGMAGILGGLGRLGGGGRVPTYPLQTDIGLPYPQKKKKKDKQASYLGDEARAIVGQTALNTVLPPEVADVVAGPATAALHGHRNPTGDGADPKQDRLRTAFTGFMRGVSQLPGALAGGAIGNQIGNQLTGELPPGAVAVRHFLHPVVRSLKSGLGGLAGAVAGGYASRRALNPFTEQVVEKAIGPAPAKKDAKPAEKAADVADFAVKNLGLASQPGDPHPTIGSTAWMRGDGQTSPGNIPWALPAAVGAGAAGLWGGHKVVNWLLKQKRKSDLDKELAAARKEYEDAMMSQYDPAKLRDLGVKSAAAGHAPTALDACFESLEKRAMMGLPSLHGASGALAGGYATLAGLLGLGAGVGTYRLMEGRSGDKLLAKALKQRAQQRLLANPPELRMHLEPHELAEDGDDKSESRKSRDRDD